MLIDLLFEGYFKITANRNIGQHYMARFPYNPIHLLTERNFKKKNVCVYLLQTEGSLAVLDSLIIISFILFVPIA